jgi:hypothetical protein
MTQNTAQSEALQAVRLLYVAACGGGSSDHKNPEMIYRARVLLEGFIEGAGVLEYTEESPKKPKWIPFDKPYSLTDLDGFTLLDEVKVYSSEQRWFVVGLDFKTDEIICNAVDYYNPFVQNRFSSKVLTFVSHGASVYE